MCSLYVSSALGSAARTGATANDEPITQPMRMRTASGARARLARQIPAARVTLFRLDLELVGDARLGRRCRSWVRFWRGGRGTFGVATWFAPILGAPGEVGACLL